MTTANRFKLCQIDAAGRLVDAMRSLEESSVQMVLITGKGNLLVGTITDGDIRRALLIGAALEAEALPFANRNFVRVGPSATRVEVLELMQARTIHQIPITDDEGRLVGLHLLHEILGTEERRNWGVVMAGGRGTRLLPLTERMPKPMLQVAGRPILERLVLHLVGSGIRRIFIAVNHLAETIERHFGDGSQWGCQIEYLREARPLGTGGPLTLLPERPSDPLVALNGDLVVQFEVARMLEFHSAGGFAATVGVHDYTHTVPFGVVEIDGQRVRDLKEKPTYVWPTNAGIYILQPDLIGRVPHDTEFPLPALLEQCLDRGEPVGAFRIDSEWIDVGRLAELQRARGHA